VPLAAVLLPLASAFLYAIGALMLKRATQFSPDPWRVTFVVNWLLAAMFAPFWALGGSAYQSSHLLHAAICGATFFVGQIFTFLAISRGDVSVATPVLGTKVLFVAIFTLMLTAEPLNSAIWAAAFLATVATALLGGGSRHAGSRVGPSLGYGFLAAGAFALTDVLCLKWAPLWSFGRFAPAMFLCVALLSLALIPFFRGSLAQLSWRWVAPGASLLALQSSGIAYSIIVFGSATITNVLYSSRGLWSVVLVWTIGSWFANVESEQGRGTMVRRLIASLLILAAIALSIHQRPLDPSPASFPLPAVP
jgi:drug/metabolite transporter (DMT)-like permease